MLSMHSEESAPEAVATPRQCYVSASLLAPPRHQHHAELLSRLDNEVGTQQTAPNGSSGRSTFGGAVELGVAGRRIVVSALRDE
jgi:hypothetical protein